MIKIAICDDNNWTCSISEQVILEYVKTKQKIGYLHLEV